MSEDRGYAEESSLYYFYTVEYFLRQQKTKSQFFLGADALFYETKPSSAKDKTASNYDNLTKKRRVVPYEKTNNEKLY